MTIPLVPNPCCRPSGPTSGVKIALVGEAPGKQEELLGSPFVGSSGQELTRMLADAGIDRKECYITNVFMSRPPGNKLDSYCGKKAEVGGKDYTLPPLRQGKYIKPEYLYELDRLKEELSNVRPNVVVALGGTASWALLQNPKITTIRGTVAESTLVPGCKVLPTFHPAAILRQWGNRPVVIADLMKAEKEQEFPEIRRPSREIWLEPTFKDITEFISTYLLRAKKITYDIETAHDMITCIGFAGDSNHALCIPFVDRRNPSFSYWNSPVEEVKAWEFVKAILSLDIHKEAQNGLYDIQWLWRKMGIAPQNSSLDTMLQAHALQPELPKGLGFLGSIYTNESSWKQMRKVKGKDIIKKDD